MCSVDKGNRTMNTRTAIVCRVPKFLRQNCSQVYANRAMLMLHSKLCPFPFACPAFAMASRTNAG